MLSLLTPRQSDGVGGPIGSMREAKAVASYPNYDAAYLAKRLGAQRPQALEHNRYKSANQFDSSQKEMVYLQNATKGYEAEAEECLKKEFKDWLGGVHEDNYYPKPYDNTKGGAIRRDMSGERMDSWVPTWWGPSQLTYLPGVREYLREEAMNADKNSLDMNKLAHLGPQNVEEAWAYFKHWVKGRPVGPEECLHPSPAAAGDHTRPFRAGARHMQHETQYNAENPYTGVSFPRTPMATASQVAAQMAQALLGANAQAVAMVAAPPLAAAPPAPPLAAALPVPPPAPLAVLAPLGAVGPPAVVAPPPPAVVAPPPPPAVVAPPPPAVVVGPAVVATPGYQQALAAAQQAASGAYTQQQQARVAASAADARAAVASVMSSTSANTGFDSWYATLSPDQQREYDEAAAEEADEARNAAALAQMGISSPVVPMQRGQQRQMRVMQNVPTPPPAGPPTPTSGASYAVANNSAFQLRLPASPLIAFSPPPFMAFSPLNPGTGPRGSTLLRAGFPPPGYSDNVWPPP